MTHDRMSVFESYLFCGHEEGVWIVSSLRLKASVATFLTCPPRACCNVWVGS